MENSAKEILFKMERVRQWEESGEVASRSDLEYLDSYIDSNNFAEVEE